MARVTCLQPPPHPPLPLPSAPLLRPAGRDRPVYNQTARYLHAGTEVLLKPLKVGEQMVNNTFMSCNVEFTGDLHGKAESPLRFTK